MPDWLGLAILLIFGILLLVLEIVLIPGAIVGIIGLSFLIIAIVVSFNTYGAGIGIAVLVFSSILFIGALVYGFRTNLWDKISLKDTNTGRAYEDEDITLQVGERGRALSSIKPIGKGEFKDTVVEVASMGNYINAGQKIEIIAIKGSKIFVETIKEKS